MLKLWLLRHSLTEGNRKKRYIGVTDEPLCPEGRELLKENPIYKARQQSAEQNCIEAIGPELLFVSPKRRCQETAEILFPDLYPERQIIPELSECDFGEFENRNYLELSGNKNYQAWIDSGGTLPFPGGESREACRQRNLKGFEKVVKACMASGKKNTALVVHGGTIMNIMEAWAFPEKSFYEWHVENGHGYLISLEEKDWCPEAPRRKLSVLKKL